jgi:hypothetical protein
VPRATAALCAVVFARGAHGAALSESAARAQLGFLSSEAEEAGRVWSNHSLPTPCTSSCPVCGGSAETDTARRSSISIASWKRGGVGHTAILGAGQFCAGVSYVPLSLAVCTGTNHPPQLPHILHTHFHTPHSLSLTYPAPGCQTGGRQIHGARGQQDHVPHAEPPAVHHGVLPRQAAGELHHARPGDRAAVAPGRADGHRGELPALLPAQPRGGPQPRLHPQGGCVG